MKQHQYKITLQHTADPEGNPIRDKQIEFSAPNHEDIFTIIEKTGKRENFTPEMAQRFAVGLKLFSEVMLENRKDPLFERLLPHFRAMMKIIKEKNQQE
ncbi:uncharacterized protein DUF3861 [Mesocricetibacter intestinalis]|uniref:Uncharacterized protein DUF3861 n=1 Tax=Mesocricetibacter intestinalis TaxID=1521930 RepID=A0A4R6V729_9PAST|nr:DUF3861 domain-containing protein [Mesocricetibacter intestinalis]TDQ56793.1 uncharacterized protein DUF3861 [Mesocricetibacter intestinalis]